MTKPLIQIALDSTDLDTAVSIANNVESFVDVIEVGTILAFAEGMKAVRTLRASHPDHIIVCDMKTTDGGAILARMAFEAGANWLTVSAAAHIATIEACKKIADELGGEIQIELYGNWTLEDAQAWVDLGIKQAFTTVHAMLNLQGLAGQTATSTVCASFPNSAWKSPSQAA